MRLSFAGFVTLSRAEPFRIFFPLGLLIGVIGVSLWPLFFLGAISVYPATAHARLMIEGFVACFLFGFLGTAGPRVMSVPHFSGAEVSRLLIGIITTVGVHLFGRHTWGDALFVATLALFVVSLAARFARRNDSPPPNFALVGLGLLNGLVGSALMFFCAATGSHPDLYRLGASLLHVGFPLLPLLGVGPFFLRRLLDLPSDDHGTRRASGAAFAIAVALVIDASFVFEVFAWNGVLVWIRAAVVVVYLLVALPWESNSLLAGALRMSFAAIAGGLGLMALLPGQRVAALHVLLVAGVSVAILAVATRVILGHSDNLALLQRRRRWLITAFILIILGMISRYVADFRPSRDPHLHWGAIVWLIGVGIWSVVVLPHVRTIGEDLTPRFSVQRDFEAAGIRDGDYVTADADELLFATRLLHRNGAADAAGCCSFCRNPRRAVCSRLWRSATAPSDE